GFFWTEYHHLSEPSVRVRRPIVPIRCNITLCRNHSSPCFPSSIQRVIVMFLVLYIYFQKQKCCSCHLKGNHENKNNKERQTHKKKKKVKEKKWFMKRKVFTI